MYYYTAYGLIIRSEIRLPEFVQVPEQNMDVIIRIGKIDSSLKGNDKDIKYKVLGNDFFWSWKGVGDYLICNGREILIEPDLDGDNFSNIRQPLYGSAMAAVLKQRGFLILHANAIEVKGKVVVIAGDKGYGKSTLTAALQANGHRVVSDDITAISIKKNNVYIMPGLPNVKLWPDAVKAIGLDPEMFPLVHSQMSKRLVVNKEQFNPDKVPLGMMITLGSGSLVELTGLVPTEKVMYLFSYNYFARLSNDFPMLEQKREFEQCAYLANNFIMKKLKRPRNLNLLKDSVSIIEHFVCVK